MKISGFAFLRNGQKFGNPPNLTSFAKATSCQQ